MKPLAFLLASVIFFSVQSASAQQPQSHWLIGHWEGTIENYRSKEGPDRTLRVHAVSPDGKAVGRSSVTGMNSVAIDVVVEGVQIKFLLPSKNLVELKREGDDRLVGNYTLPDGRAFPLTLKRIKLSSDFDGDWRGSTGQTGAGCGGVHYDLSIKDSLISGKFTVVYRDGTTFYSNVTGEVDTTGKAIIELKGVRNTQFAGTFTKTEFRANDPRYGDKGNAQCSYENELKRR